jgi:hypothetical protein
VWEGCEVRREAEQGRWHIKEGGLAWRVYISTSYLWRVERESSVGREEEEEEKDMIWLGLAGLGDGVCVYDVACLWGRGLIDEC